MLNSKQKKVAYELSGNTIVSASPGTGKTKTLVARAERKLESLPKHKSLALITYTNAGADEIASRLVSDEDNIFIGTIHRFCLQFILRPYSWIYNWDNPRIVTFDELKEFFEINEKLDLGDDKFNELGKIKYGIDGKLNLSVEWSHKISIEEVAEIYFQFLKSKGAIDINEILYRSYKIISENNFVVTSLANKFYEISIDEFQDTNIFQYEILKTINSKSICTFFIVGDEKQKIYRFAGAIDNAFDNATIDFSCEIENLDITYRSTTNIVDAYSCLYDNHPSLENKSKYNSINEPLLFVKTDSNNNNEIIQHYIAEIIRKYNVPVNEIAILTNSWRDAFFISRHLRKTFHIVGLGALPHKNFNSSTLSLVKSISKFILKPCIRNLRVIRRDVEFHALENNLILNDKEITIASNNLISKINSVEKTIFLLEGLKELKSIFNFIFKINHSAFDELISAINDDEADYWDLLKYMKTVSGMDGITVNTIHQAKGLEYEVVFLNNVSEGSVPYQYWDPVSRQRHPLTDNNLIDGKAKLYVGISRARKILIILHNWMPSLFIPIIKRSEDN